MTSHYNLCFNIINKTSHTNKVECDVYEEDGDDSGLVADAFEILLDEETLALDPHIEQFDSDILTESFESSECYDLHCGTNVVFDKNHVPSKVAGERNKRDSSTGLFRYEIFPKIPSNNAKENCELSCSSPYMPENNDNTNDNFTLIEDGHKVLPVNLSFGSQPQKDLDFAERHNHCHFELCDEVYSSTSPYDEAHSVTKETGKQSAAYNLVKYESLLEIPSNNTKERTAIKEAVERENTSRNKQKAREWRRKRIFPAKSKRKFEWAVKRTQKSLPGKQFDIKQEKTVQDPLLGGEKIRANREAVPMKLRALPESFWNEPNHFNDSTLAGCGDSILPPLFSLHTDCRRNTDEGLDVLQTVEEIESTNSPLDKNKWEMASIPNHQLLFHLFDQLEDRNDNNMIVRRGRPKKKEEHRIPKPPPKDKNGDPCIIDALATKLFPELSLNQNLSGKKRPPNYSVVRIGEGRSRIEFPAIQVQKNYPAILNELVSHM